MSLEIIDRLLPDGVSRIGERPAREVSAALQFWRVEYKSAGEMELAVVTWEGLHDNWGKIEQRIDELESAAIPGVRMPTGYWYEGRTAIFLLPDVGTPIPEVAPAAYTEQELEKIRTQLETICDRLAQENICHEGIVADALFWDAGNKQISLEGAPWAILASISKGACMPYDLSLAEPPEWKGKIQAGTPKSDQYALGMALAYIAAGKRQAQQLACDLHGDDEAASERVLRELKEQLQGHTCPASLRKVIPTLLDKDPALRVKSGGGNEPIKIPWPVIITLCLCVLIFAIGFFFVKGRGTKNGPLPPPPGSKVVWEKIISGIKKRHNDELPVFGDFIQAANREVSDFKPKEDQEKAQTVLRVIRQWHSEFRKERLDQWLGEGTDQQVKTIIENKLRQCYEDPFTKKEGPAFKLARYLTGINKAVDLWKKWAEEDIPFSEFKTKGGSLRAADKGYPNGFREGESLFVSWCNKTENLKAARVQFLSGVDTGSKFLHREVHLSIGGVDVFEEKHTWTFLESKGRRVFDYKDLEGGNTRSFSWKPDATIVFKLEGDRNQLIFLGLAADPNIIAEELGGPVSLWRLRVRGFFQGNKNRTKVTLRVIDCPGPPNSLSREDIAIGKDLLGL